MKIKLNDETTIDLSTLIDTRLLVQANSGGGKSWLIRRILEQSHGKVQQIVIDLEGEFSTLREKYDYVLAGKGGDTPAEPRSAALLARRILELNVSAIIDLYELDQFNRKRFVKLFLDAMVNARKELWHPCMVIIDEAHVFCPEKGQAESAGSVIDLATRGRKRGYCAVLATQRLSKLHKDAAAECNNKLIGRTGLDVDMKRASEELGFTSKEQYLSLRALRAGEFFAFGPAISLEVKKVSVGEVETTHPKAGSRILTAAPIPPTQKIRDILGKLSDLPKEAQEEAQTIDDLKREIAQLKRAVPARNITDEDIKKAVEPHLIALQTVENGYKVTIQNWKEYASGMRQALIDLSRIANARLERFDQMPSEESGAKYMPPWQDKASDKPITKESLKNLKPWSHRPKEFPPFPRLSPNEAKKEVDEIMEQVSKESVDKPITGGALRMLRVLASRYPMTFSKSQLATLSKLSPRSGTFSTYFSALKSNNYITATDNIISITEEGLRFIGSSGKVEPQTTQETLEMWKNNLSGGARKMFEYLIGIYPSYTTKNILGEETGLSSTSGTFGTYLSMLRSNGLIEVVDGTIKASPNLFV